MPQKVTHHCPRHNRRGTCVNVKARKNISPLYCRTHKVLCTKHRPYIAHLSTEKCPSCAKALLLKTKRVKKSSGPKKGKSSKKNSPVKKSSSGKKGKTMMKKS